MTLFIFKGKKKIGTDQKGDKQQLKARKASNFMQKKAETYFSEDN